LACAAALAKPTQKPAPHAAHDEGEVSVMPPADHVPAGQGLCVGDPVPAGQK